MSDLIRLRKDCSKSAADNMILKAEKAKMREALEAILEEAEDGGSKEIRAISRMAKFVLEGTST